MNRDEQRALANEIAKAHTRERDRNSMCGCIGAFVLCLVFSVTFSTCFHLVTSAAEPITLKAKIIGVTDGDTLTARRSATINNMRNPTQSGHRFRAKAATHSDAKRPPIPTEGGHRFQSNPISHLRGVGGAGKR